LRDGRGNAPEDTILCTPRGMCILGEITAGVEPEGGRSRPKNDDEADELNKHWWLRSSIVAGKRQRHQAALR